MATIQSFRERVSALSTSTTSISEQPKFNGHAAFGFGFRSLFRKMKPSKDSGEVWYTIPTVVLRKIFFACDVVGVKSDRRCSSVREHADVLLHHLKTESAKYPSNYTTTSQCAKALEAREKVLVRSLNRYVDAARGGYANRFTEAEALDIVNSFRDSLCNVHVIYGDYDCYSMSIVLDNPETPLASRGFFYFDRTVVDASLSDDELKVELESINTAQIEANFIDWLNNIDPYCGSAKSAVFNKRKFKPFCKWYPLQSDSSEEVSSDIACDDEIPCEEIISIDTSQ